MTRATTWICAGVALWQATAVNAQSLGTFRWQLQPYCNVVTATVVQDGGQYQLDGTDDQCGATRKAGVVGLAFPNPDGTIGLGLTIVTTPGGAPVHLDARISIATVSGPWNDSAGGSGTFAFTPGAGTGGSPRPPAPPAIPPAFLLAPSGNFLSKGSVGGSGPIPASGPGVRMMWYPGKAAFRAGGVNGSQWDDATVGPSSMAMGFNTTASGSYSTATGQSTTASGNSSTAMGVFTTASGESSTAMGFRTRASGGRSTAMGQDTTASGDGSFAAGFDGQAVGNLSVAIGAGPIANGYQSIALGRGFTTAGATGSFVFGDQSSLSAQAAFAPNTFVVRAAGGARFFSHATNDIGPVLIAGGADWTAVSDVNVKHRFRDLDGEDVLGRIARMPVAEWSYKAQDPAVRHIGPTAQDFHAAFGLGQDPLRISPLDSGGVALASVRALEARTRALPARATALETENAALHLRLTAAATEVASLRERLERLERMQASLPEGVVPQERR